MDKDGWKTYFRKLMPSTHDAGTHSSLFQKPSTVDNQNNKIGTGMGLFIAKGIISKYPDAMIALLPVETGFGIRTIFKIK